MLLWDLHTMFVLSHLVAFTTTLVVEHFQIGNKLTFQSFCSHNFFSSETLRITDRLWKLACLIGSQSQLKQLALVALWFSLKSVPMLAPTFTSRGAWRVLCWAKVCMKDKPPIKKVLSFWQRIEIHTCWWLLLLGLGVEGRIIKVWTLLVWGNYL